MGMRKHDALPQPDSMIRERDRAEVDGNTPADYPLLARCESCHREIKIEAALGTGWKHTAAPRPPRGDEIAKLTEIADLYGGIAQLLQARAEAKACGGPIPQGDEGSDTAHE
jgi:hypothetical protein